MVPSPHAANAAACGARAHASHIASLPQLPMQCTHRCAKKTPRLRKGCAGHPVSRSIRATSSASIVWQPNCGRAERAKQWLHRQRRIGGVAVHGHLQRGLCECTALQPNGDEGGSTSCSMHPTCSTSLL